MISEQVRKMTQVHWIMLFLAISVAWIFLYLLSVPNELRLLSKIYGVNFFNEFCIITPDVSGFFQIFSMWILMSAAMMAPTALPAFAVYEELGDNVEINLLRLLLGYLSVWIVCSVFLPKIVKVNRNSPHPETESDLSRPLHIVWAHRWYVLPL